MLSQFRMLPDRRLLLERCLLKISQQFHHSQTLELLREIESTPNSRRSEILTSQFKRLSLLLAHAELRVPYYREMFRSLRIKSCDIRNLQDFAGLPVLTKDIVRERQRDLIQEDIPFDSLIPGHTSGSTGTPLSFYHDRLSNNSASAGNFRNFRQSGWRVGEVIATFIGVYSIARRWKYVMTQALRSNYQFNVFDAGPEQMEKWVKKWQSLNPRIAYGFPSMISKFAEHIIETGKYVTPLRGVFTTGEKLYQYQRNIISCAFNCRVYDCYGSSEVCNIAAECPHGRLHVNADFVVLETENGSHVGAAPSQLIMTSLWNFAMPFIRYRNEDCGTLIDGICSCDNNFPLMRLDITRQTDYFILPRGRVIHGMFFAISLLGSKGIDNFQFHQTATDSIILWIVPKPGLESEKERAIRQALEEIRTLVPSDVKVHVQEVKEIPFDPAGKYHYIRSDLIRNGATVRRLPESIDH
jgi:phenylacetate-CoA ligase